MSIPTQITDTQGNVIYSSQKASVLTKQQFESESGSRISEHTIMYKMEISGGFGFWQYDMSEIDRLNSELTDAKECLKQEVELVKLKNELKEKRTKLANLMKKFGFEPKLIVLMDGGICSQINQFAIGEYYKDKRG